ncbi:Uncharacterised protein [Edwardsiella tarda]|nr:Uncharacterised protein [Edwardsiella tarda]
MGCFVLSGTCYYELLGLKEFFLSIGEQVVVYDDDHEIKNVVKKDDVLVFALSDEPLLGWGRHINRIRNYYYKLPCPIIVIVPPKLRTIKIFHEFCATLPGGLTGLETVEELQLFHNSSFSNERKHFSNALLSIKQREILNQVAFRCSKNSPLRNGWKKNDYYHCGKLLSVLGVDNLHTLSVIGFPIRNNLIHCKS